MEQENSHAAAYISFQTFKASLETLSQALPKSINRTVFPGLAWSVQSHLFSAFKFLDLTDENGVPTETLARLATPSEADRKRVLATIVRSKYAKLVELDLQKATPKDVLDALESHYGTKGSTKAKAFRFFLAAVEYCDIPLGPFLAGKSPQGTKQGAARKRTARRKSTKLQNPPDGEFITIDLTAQGTQRTVKLASGGTLTLAASLDILKLNVTDRKFVFALIDQLDAYESSNAAVAEDEY